MALPEKPLTRRETYLAKAAGQDVTLPETDLTREELYLRAIAEGGGGGGTSPFYPAGNTAFVNLPELSEDILGAMYNITDAFTTDSRFNEGAGVDYPAGTNVAVVNVGTAESPVLKYDTFAGAYVVDNALSDASENPVQNKVIKSTLDGKATPADIAALIDDTTAAQNKAYSSAKVEEKIAGEEITATATGSDLTLSTAEGNLNALTVYGKSEVVDGAIKSAGDSGSIEIETCEKNLLDPTKLVTENITYTDGTLSGAAKNFLTAFGGGVPILFDKTRQITFSTKAYTNGTTITGYGLYVRFVYTDDTRDTIKLPNNTTEPQVFTQTSNSRKQVQSIEIIYGTAGSNVWYLSEIQLEYGSAATAYEPYNGTMATFTTGTPLRGIPNGAKDVAEWDGSTGEVTKACGKITLDNTSNVRKWADVTNGFYISIGETDTIKSSGSNNIPFTGISNVPIISANAIVETTSLSVACTKSGDTLRFVIPDVTTIEDAKTYLQTNPIYIVYELATPTTTPLTSAEVQNFNDLRTFAPQTHVQNNAGAEMTASAYAGTENGKAVADLKSELKITQSDTLTLTVNGWSNNAQTVTFAHDTAKRNVIDVDPSSVEEWANCGVLATAETASGITFTCKTVPTNALTFRVTSMGV